MMAARKPTVTHTTRNGYKVNREQPWTQSVTANNPGSGDFSPMKKLSERRETERFGLKVPAIVRQISESNGKRHHLLLTRDISNQGAYFNAIDDFTYEGPVEVEVLLKVPGEEDDGNYVYMQTCGEVVRREETGLAIRFNGESSLKPFYREKLS